MQIKIQARSVYGEIKIYPVCDKAKHFAEIAKRLGFTLVELDRYGQVCREHVPGSGRELKGRNGRRSRPYVD